MSTVQTSPLAGHGVFVRDTTNLWLAQLTKTTLPVTVSGISGWVEHNFQPSRAEDGNGTMRLLPGTDSRGGSFDLATVERAWRTAQLVLGCDPSRTRKDSCGAWIRRTDYGLTTEYGREIDHIFPVALGGNDGLANLQPLHSRNNRGKDDRFPHWSCSVSAG